MKNTISAIILTKNEEKNIKDCLENLKWCDEIIVIDDDSEDQTVKIAEGMGAKIFRRALDSDFASQRNYGLLKAKGGWVFFVDADERVSEVLASEITNSKLQISNKINGYSIKRRDFMWRRELKHGETASIRLLRLAKKDAGEWQGKVHEVWNVKGEIGKLKNSLYHYPHQSVKEFLKEINHYSDLRSKELYEEGVKSNFLSIIIYTKGKFLVNYFLKLGFLDGVRGLIFALMMSFHSFLTRGKLWNLWQRR